MNPFQQDDWQLSPGGPSGWWKGMQWESAGVVRVSRRAEPKTRWFSEGHRSVFISSAGQFSFFPAGVFHQDYSSEEKKLEQQLQAHFVSR